eukprot:SAG11_NODE_2984_length_2791_cov_1.161961_3_plen_65_part_00
MRADINVFDLPTLNVLPPSYVNDFPLGAGRWVQGVVGCELPTFRKLGAAKLLALLVSATALCGA